MNKEFTLHQVKEIIMKAHDLINVNTNDPKVEEELDNFLDNIGITDEDSKYDISGFIRTKMTHEFYERIKTEAQY